MTADDQGSIRLWDIRNFTCHQLLVLGKGTIIHTLLDASTHDRVASVGNRLNIIQFEKKLTDEPLYATFIDFDTLSGEFMLATRRDVRLYSS